MKVKNLKSKDKNPRKISDANLDRLAKSISRDPDFMRLRPIVIDEKNVVLGGNQRLRAIRDVLAMKEVPDEWVAQVSDLTDEQKRRFVLVDNGPTGMTGDWDIDMLSAEYDIPELEELGFEGETLYELSSLAFGDGEDGDYIDGESFGKGKSAVPVKVMLYPDVVEIFERAIKSTGEKNRAKALTQICEAFLDAKGQWRITA